MIATSRTRLLAAVLLVQLCSCASLMTGDEDTVTIQSMPPGARFYTNTGVRGTTPRTITVPAAEDLVVNYSLPGYEPQEVLLESRLSAWILGNAIFGGFIGLAIDIVNPDARTHDSVVSADLVQKDAGSWEEEERTEKVDFLKPRKAEIRPMPREIGASHYERPPRP